MRNINAHTNTNQVQWVGFGCSYAHGDFQWRFPLAFRMSKHPFIHVSLLTWRPPECLPALIVMIGIWFLPFSPRWLLEQDRDDEAFAVIKRLHGSTGSDTFFRAEFTQMREQLRFEKTTAANGPTWGEIFSKKNYRMRLLLAVLVQVFTQLSGINVINYYQTDLYKGLGMSGHMVTLLAG